MEFVIFVAGLIIGGLISWFITHQYFIKAGEDQKKRFRALEERLRSKNTLHEFEDLLESSTWHKEFIDHSEVWIADNDITFQIELGNELRQFKEKWTDIYPDPNSSASPVYLKVNGNVIKEITFISMDGGRIFIPLPDLQMLDDDSVEYFWNLNSLEVKVGRVVGVYYIYNNLEGVAKRSKIEIID